MIVPSSFTLLLLFVFFSVILPSVLCVERDASLTVESTDLTRDISEIRYQVHCPKSDDDPSIQIDCVPHITTYDRAALTAWKKLKHASNPLQVHLPFSHFSQSLAPLIEEFGFFSLDSEYSVLHKDGSFRKKKYGIKTITVSWIDPSANRFLSKTVENYGSSGPENLKQLESALEEFEATLAWYSAPESVSSILEIVSEKTVALKNSFEIHSKVSFARDGAVVIEERSQNSIEELIKKFGWMARIEFEKIAQFLLEQDILGLPSSFGEMKPGAQGTILTITWKTTGIETEEKKFTIWQENAAPHKLQLFQELLQEKFSNLPVKELRINWTIFYFGAGGSIGLSLFMVIFLIIYYIRRTCLFNHGTYLDLKQPELVFKNNA